MYSLSFAGAGTTNSPEKTTSSKVPPASSSMPEVVPEIVNEPSMDQDQAEVQGSDQKQE